MSGARAQTQASEDRNEHHMDTSFAVGNCLVSLSLLFYELMFSKRTESQMLVAEDSKRLMLVIFQI